MFLAVFIPLLMKKIPFFFLLNWYSLSVMESLITSCGITLIHLHTLVPKGFLEISSLI